MSEAVHTERSREAAESKWAANRPNAEVLS